MRREVVAFFVFSIYSFFSFLSSPPTSLTLNLFFFNSLSSASSLSPRGLVATVPVPETSRPLVAIPEPLVLTPAAALFSLERSRVLRESSSIDALAGYSAAANDLMAPISLVLAADALRIEAMRKEQQKSFEETGWEMSPWGAYTASLSPPPSSLGRDEGRDEGEEASSSSGCAGWFLSPEAREAALLRSFPSSSERNQIKKMLDETLRVETEAAEATIEAAGLGKQEEKLFTPQLLLWARSQICSRAFAAPSGGNNDDDDNGIVPALLPVIDLCNHSPGGGFPAWGVVSSKKSSSSSSSSGSGSGSGSSSSPSSSPPPPRLCWLRNAAPLSTGEELTTDYSRLCGSDGGAWMANYGFVPAEVK